VRHSAIAKPKTPGLGSFVRNVAAQELLVDALGFTPARGTRHGQGAGHDCDGPATPGPAQTPSTIR
jgi:hypothetical protein